MIKQEYTITRTRATWKPRVTDRDLPFITDPNTGDVFVGFGGAAEATFEGTGRTLVATWPYASIDAAPQGMACAPLHEAESGAHGCALDYQISGGFNNNAIIVTWKCPSEHPLEWVCLKTFTGMQMKYATSKKKKLVFGLADEDAFAYCNKIPCKECGFRCKSGFVLYGSFKGVGIVKMPVERISMLNLDK